MSLYNKTLLNMHLQFRLIDYFCFTVLQEKASRIDRIVTEHQLFSQGLKDLQNWVADTSHMLQTYCAPTADKNVLDSRMIKLEVCKVRFIFRVAALMTKNTTVMSG